MTYATDPRVDAYIDPLPEWQQAVCRQVRELVHVRPGEPHRAQARAVLPDADHHAVLARMAAHPQDPAHAVPPDDDVAEARDGCDEHESHDDPAFGPCQGQTRGNTRPARDGMRRSAGGAVPWAVRRCGVTTMTRGVGMSPARGGGDLRPMDVAAHG